MTRREFCGTVAVASLAIDIPIENRFPADTGGMHLPVFNLQTGRIEYQFPGEHLRCPPESDWRGRGFSAAHYERMSIQRALDMGRAQQTSFWSLTK